MPSLSASKKQICEVGRRIWLRGFCGGNEGNLSLRISQNRVLCTPTGVSKGFLTPAMLCTVDLEGAQIDTRNTFKRTSEILLHLAIYRKRPDVRAVVHSHSPHATAFAVSGVPIPEGIHPEAELFLGKVPTAPYTTPGYTGLGQSVCDLITPETNTVLLGNHGSVTFDATLQGAYDKLEILDAYCRILLLAHQFGHINPLTQTQMIDLLNYKKKFGLTDARLSNSKKIGSNNAPYLKGLAKPSRQPRS
jgi:L-fuculose-phosphate aldolase